MGKQTKYQLMKVYKPGTYIIDFVNFSSADYPLEVLFLVDGNSRYLTIYRINQKKFGEGVQFTDDHRNAAFLVNALDNFGSSGSKKIKMLIGDGDSVFFSKAVEKWCQKNKVETDFRDAVRTDHTHTAILDRIVRTIRDMIFNLRPKFETIDLESVVKVYNNTRHETLTKVLGFPATPEMVYRNEDLELLLIKNIRAINWTKQRQYGYELKPGQRVYVRMRTGLFESKRAQVKQTIYRIRRREGSMYYLENEEGKLYLHNPVARRDLKPAK